MNGLVRMRSRPFTAPGASRRAASAMVRISFKCGILVMRIRSIKASAARRMPHMAKGDWGREKDGVVDES